MRHIDCGHRKCWVEQAHVTELTPLLREGPDGDQLAGWPASMRVFARRERPHPGAQLSLFETRDGWRYSLWATNQPTNWAGWRADPAYIDAAHRVHARVEDRIRTGKDCGLGRFPSFDFAMNSAWLACAGIAATLLAWLRHLALDGELAKAEPKTLALPHPARRRPARPKRPPPTAAHRRDLALGKHHHDRLDTDHHDAAGPLTSTKPSLRSQKGTRGLWNPRPPGPTAGPLSHPHGKIKIHQTAASRATVHDASA